MYKRYSPYRPARAKMHRPAFWQRLLDRVAAPNLDHNYDRFADQDRAEAAVTALLEAGSPARVALTDTGPVVLVKGRFRRRAAPVIAPFESDG